jgi:hypothetical protein
LHPKTHSLTRPNSLPFFSAGRPDLRGRQPLQIGGKFGHANYDMQGAHRSEGGRLQKVITDPVDGTFIADLNRKAFPYKAMVQHAGNDAFRGIKGEGKYRAQPRLRADGKVLRRLTILLDGLEALSSVGYPACQRGTSRARGAKGRSQLPAPFPGHDHRHAHYR